MPEQDRGLDARGLPEGAEMATTVCVVGSGPAGTTVALGLADAGIEVLVVEAGGWRAERGAQATLAGAGVGPGDHDRLERAREKRVGGTSASWGGRCSPLDPLDLEDRPPLGLTGWPIGTDAMERHYRRAGAILQLGRWAWTIREAVPWAPSFLVPPGSDSQLDDARILRWSPPTRFAAEIAAGLAPESPHLVAAPRHRRRHRADGVTGPVRRLRIASTPGRHLTVRADLVVLALGGLETARLLLHGDGQGTAIGDDEGLLGRHYMIHPGGEVGRLHLGDPAAAFGAGDFVRSSDRVWVRRLLQLHEDVRRREGLLNLAATPWYADPHDPRHADPLLSTFALVRKSLTLAGGFKGTTDVHRRYSSTDGLGGHLRNIASDVPGIARFAASWTKHRWLAPRSLPAFARTTASGEYRLHFDAEQSPDPANRVLLSAERDALGVPRLQVVHRVSADDRANYHRSLVRMAEAVRRLGTATLSAPAEDELAVMPFGNATHQMGLAGWARRRAGVVDPDGRVWGVANLYVAGSAVFPTSGMAAPTMTIVALAARLAERLVGALRPVTA